MSQRQRYSQPKAQDLLSVPACLPCPKDRGNSPKEETVEGAAVEGAAVKGAAVEGAECHKSQNLVGYLRLLEANHNDPPSFHSLCHLAYLYERVIVRVKVRVGVC